MFPDFIHWVNWRMVFSMVACNAGLAVVLRALVGQRRSKRGTHHGNLLAYNATSMIINCVCAYIGIKGYLEGSAAACAGSAHDRLYCNSPRFLQLAEVTAAYELYAQRF
jgi:hypothetical protein